jgi:hypothetical protein
MGTSTSRSGLNGPKGNLWSGAKRRATSFVRGTGVSAGSVVGRLVSATGGPGTSRRAVGGRRARGGWASSIRSGQTLGFFLSSVASSGLDQTLRSIGLGHLIGQTPNVILPGIADHICGNGGLLDDAISRSAVVEVLAAIFDESDDTYAELRDRWDSQLDESRIVELMSLFLSQAIYQRFLVELAEKFEANALSTTEAEQRENEIFEFIKEMVKFEMGEIDPLRFDWKGPEGEEMIRRNLAAAIDQLETYQ